MEYRDITPAEFLTRPNRFIAQVLVDGREETVHVKNTGRCRELLVPGATVYLEKARNPARRTAYSLVAVQKGDRLINMDSQAPNRVLEEALRGGLVLPGMRGAALRIRREVVFGGSRLDFALEDAAGEVMAEVKGVTLERDGVALFPDAPTQRGVRHLGELERAVERGMRACAVFIVQMQGMRRFSPNEETHPEFGAALRRAQKAGVAVCAYNCRVTPGSLVLKDPVEVRL